VDEIHDKGNQIYEKLASLFMHPMINTKDYIKFVKSHHCLICGKSPVDPDHLEHLGMGGANKNGIKDFSCINLCRVHHRERHDLGTKRFEEKYNVNLWKEAFNLIRKYFTQ
jgi:hypothetical protein